MLIAIDSDNFNHIPSECMRCGLRNEDRWCYASPPNHSLEPIPLKGRADWCPLKEIVYCESCRYYKLELHKDGALVNMCEHPDHHWETEKTMGKYYCKDGERVKVVSH
jgi:NAD-dependent dihydropyrimidine dehydrogenase PreA subunit